MRLAAPRRGAGRARWRIVAHELRSPLNGIKTWAHVLEGELPRGRRARRNARLAGIMAGIEQQVRLVEGLESSGGIRQVLAELVDRAAELTAAGGTIRIEVAPDGSSARISVRDEGAAFDFSLPLGEARG